ncbi:hypothetical protein [Pontibacter oryzae]|nr:hypothetical protein [Pontibacter oryzae]
MKTILFSLLFILLFSCSNKSSESIEISIDDTSEIVLKNDLPNLLAHIEQNSHEEYLIAISKTKDEIANLWTANPEKISVTGFVKLSGLDEKITGYTQRNNIVEKINYIPEPIIGSFKKEAKCYLPDKGSKVKRSLTLAFEESETAMRILIEEKL